jgi:hypothetical protein
MKKTDTIPNQTAELQSFLDHFLEQKRLENTALRKILQHLDKTVNTRGSKPAKENQK